MQRSHLPVESWRFRVSWAVENRFNGGASHFAPELDVGWVWCVLEGELHVSFSGPSKTLSVRAGEWIWHPPCHDRGLHVGREGAHWLTLGGSAFCGARDFFVPRALTRFSANNGAANGGAGHDPQRGRALLQLLTQTPRENELARDGLLAAFCAWLWARSEASENDEPLPDWLREALDFLQNDPTASVKQAAKRAHFSPAQFRRLWQKHLGQSPREFLVTRRLERARSRLESETASLERLAQECGFSSGAAFSRAFKKRFGISPLFWRQNQDWLS